MAGQSSPPSIDGRQIVDSLHEPLLVLDEELRVRQANRSFYATFEAAPAETLGVSLFDLGDGQWDIPALRRRLDDVLEDVGSFERFDVDHVFRGLGRRVMRLNGRALRGENGDVHAVLLAIDDITDQRELEERLREHARELRRSNADLEQFAYAASHDLQEPLRMVSSYLQLLERRHRDDLDEEAREFIDYAVDGAVRMKALIDGLLQYSRIGRKEGEVRPVELEAVLDDVLEDLGRRMEETGAEVTREPLPRVRANPDQLRRVLQNLVENALTYHGEERPAVHLSADGGEDGMIRVSVRDRGPGIPAGAEERIFRLFHQLDPHGTGREGAGIGLALCRKIVERHGGEIWVDSEPRAGSTFHFTLKAEPGGEP